MTNKKKRVGLPIRNFTQDVCGGEYREKCEEFMRSIGKDCQFFGDDAVLQASKSPGAASAPYYCGYEWNRHEPAVNLIDHEAVGEMIIKSISKILKKLL